MNNLLLKKIFILIGIVLFFNSTKASCSLENNNDTILIASRASRDVKYTLGTDVLIRYENQLKKVNGKLIAVTRDSVLLKTRNKKASVISVAINDINSIMKLHKNARRGWIASLSVLVLLTIFGLILAEMGSFLTILVLGIPAVSLFTYIPFLAGNFLTDLLSKKSIKRGWTFRSKN